MWKFFWARPDWSDPLGEGKLLITRQDFGSRDRMVAAPLVFTELKEGRAISAPTIDFHGSGREGFQQAMMDSLWEEGVRPSDHKITAGATERHLDDMRRIVAKAHNVDLK